MPASKRPADRPPRTGRLRPPSTTIVRTEEGWSGPLPSPKALEQFRSLVPDAPERILRQWEAEAEHRRAQERTALRGAVSRERLGQAGAIVFVTQVLAVVALALWLDHPWIAAILGAGTITSVVGAFLYQRHHPRTGSTPPSP
ncbi:DUF2335 domain-containing protein [uncultured Methylobacterium sp.]|jgi:uncharacterized membrane protein|uniref:DUF2335 domain-containing protein n=1 Tax=uncultured Methylobacterium sp. TaxID=157278 RepID=UPI0026101C38|nr:DUF2335 domain-containing protein [uncultured Methylobacterium sp.]